MQTGTTNVEITIDVHQQLKTETTTRSGSSLCGYMYWKKMKTPNSKRYMYPNNSVIYSRQDMNASVQETNG